MSDPIIHSTTVLGADSEPPEEKSLVQTLPNMDVRAVDQQLPNPVPYGPTYAVVGVEEILRRGFKQLHPEEQANVIAAYLVTQKQNLSPFDSVEVAHEKRLRFESERQTHSTRQIFMLGIGILTVIAILTVIGITIYTVSKQGVLSDSGLFQGMFTMLQEVFRVIMSGGKL